MSRPRLYRRQAMLDAAAAEFFVRGYAGAAMDAIAGRLGGSKGPFYAEFGGKAALFEALVADRAQAASAKLAVDDIMDLPLPEALTAFGSRLFDASMAPEALHLYRALVAEAERFPQLTKAAYEAGPGRAAALLAGLLEAARARGELLVEDCLQAAGQFVDLLRGNLHLQVVLRLRPPPGPDERDAPLPGRPGPIPAGHGGGLNHATTR